MTQEVQEARCRDYYERILQPMGVEWRGFFYDPAVSSGRVPFAERTQGRLLFHSAEPGDHVVMTRLDRCFRSVLDGVSVMEQLDKRGVFFHSLDYNIDTSTPVGRYVRNILLAGAELERDLARERANETYSYLMSNALPYSAHPPMGWRITKRGKRKEFRAFLTERKFIDKLAQARKAGATVHDLANYCWANREELNQTRNFASPTAIKWALQARNLGYPKVCGAKRIAAMHRELLAAGGCPPI